MFYCSNNRYKTYRKTFYHNCSRYIILPSSKNTRTDVLLYLNCPTLCHRHFECSDKVPTDSECIEKHLVLKCSRYIFLLPSKNTRTDVYFNINPANTSTTVTSSVPIWCQPIRNVSRRISTQTVLDTIPTLSFEIA